jgi:hypothetical protein
LGHWLVGFGRPFFYWPIKLIILPIYLLMPIVCPFEDSKLALGSNVTYPIVELEDTFPHMLIGTLGFMHLGLVVLALVNSEIGELMFSYLQSLGWNG